MKFTLLQNAVDSLKSTYNSLEKYKETIIGRDHLVKDAVLSLNHANELLFKHILKEENEFLIFSDIHKYMSAKEKMIEKKKKNVFEVNPNLNTVGFYEAIRRLELLCEKNVPENFKNALLYINKKRNEITHYEIEMDMDEYQLFIENLEAAYEMTISFFSKYENELTSLLSEARFEVSLEITDPDVEAMAHDSYIDYMETMIP
ncbi:hypothetical protein ABEW22_19100 [Bacillus velezensis]|uniref:hypothetical protein n=1 Tax=Bacillus velezensis TaxID=492670 RepID=UPI003456A512